MFASIESVKDRLGILEYSLSQTSLEQVRYKDAAPPVGSGGTGMHVCMCMVRWRGNRGGVVQVPFELMYRRRPRACIVMWLMSCVVVLPL